MNKNTKFLTLFSLAGYFIIQLVTKSLGPPFSIIRSFFVQKFFNFSVNIDLAAARSSTINTVFYIVIVWFFLFTIKRIRDNGNANALKMLLSVVLTLIIFLVIDLAITYTASLTIKSAASTVHDIFINSFLMLSSLFYMVSLVAIANEGYISLGAIKRLFQTQTFNISFLFALILRTIPQVMAYLIKEITQNQYYIGIGVPLLIAFAFMILIKPILNKTEY